MGAARALGSFRGECQPFDLLLSLSKASAFFLQLCRYPC